MNDELLTVQEVAVIFRVDDTTIRRWVKYGALEAITLPHKNDRRQYRFRREAIEKILKTGAPSDE
jgi:excisionase family DNA binding protein